VAGEHVIPAINCVRVYSKIWLSFVRYLTLKNMISGDFKPRATCLSCSPHVSKTAHEVKSLRLRCISASVLTFHSPCVRVGHSKIGSHLPLTYHEMQEVEFEVTDRTRDKDAEEVATVTANSSSLASERADGRHLSGAEAEISSNDSRSISRCKSKITITMTPAQHWYVNLCPKFRYPCNLNSVMPVCNACKESGVRVGAFCASCHALHQPHSLPCIVCHALCQPIQPLPAPVVACPHISRLQLF